MNFEKNTLQNETDLLRQAMRLWPAGVAIVTSRHENVFHGMTINSLASVTLDPPIILVTLAHTTRTHALVTVSGMFAVSILKENQSLLADLFAGKLPESANRFANLSTFSLVSGSPLISAGLAFIDCRVIKQVDWPASTTFFGEVLAIKIADGQPLVYFNRSYRRLQI